MRSPSRVRTAIVAFELTQTSLAGATSPVDAPFDATEAAGEATTPLPIARQLRFKPMYAFPNGASAYRAELQFEALLRILLVAMAGALLPPVRPPPPRPAPPYRVSSAPRIGLAVAA
ncbi:MAG TPA: hypothetical protein VE987_05935 [Polyangiaceae bacterium]|nr:hypothetical protein [Polyangiaceae bacterium]